ncbi:MAG: APC family permease, partial [Clostridiales bacterium]
NMAKLKREIGLVPAIATAVGIVVSSSALMMLGQGFGLGGSAFIIAMILALLINLFVAFSFSELSAVMPLAGGINHYTLPAMGPMIGIFGVLSGYLVVSVFGSSAEALIAGTVVSDFFIPGSNPAVVAAVFMVLLALVNIRGIKAFAYSQVFMAGTMIASMIIMSIIGHGGGEPLLSSLTINMTAGGGIFSLLGIAFWLFIGMEFVCPMAEEVKKPRIFIPIAMISSLIIIFISDALFGSMALKYVDMETLSTSPYPHVTAASVLMGRTGQIWIGLVSLVATGSTLNTYLAAIPRMLYGMAKEGQFPAIFAKTNRWGSPYMGVILVLALSCILLIFSSAQAQEIISLLVLASCICWIAVYVIAHLNVLILRRKYPNMNRPFKVPFGPVLPVISMIGLVYMVYSIYPPGEIRNTIYLYAFLAIAACIIWSVLWVKLKMKKGLFETTPIEYLLNQAETTLENPTEEKFIA